MVYISQNALSVFGFKLLFSFLSNNMIIDNNIDWDKINSEEVSLIENEIKEQIENLLDFIKNSSLDLVVVSNEVGMGFVSTYPLGRYFGDINGRINQIVANKSDEAYYIVSGLDIKLK